jgi:adenylate cyclase
VTLRARLAALVTPLTLTIASVAVVAGLFLSHVDILDLIELRSYDLRLLARGSRPPAGAVTLVAIDEKSLDTLGRWPWPRSRLAALVDRLSAAGAKVIAFDIGFSEPDTTAPANDDALARAIASAKAKVVLGYFFHMTRAELGYELDDAEIARRVSGIAGSEYPLVLRAPGADREPVVPNPYAPEANLTQLTGVADGAGYFSLRQDEDGIIRWMPLVIASGGRYHQPLSIAAVWHFLDEPPLVVRVGRYGIDGLQVGDQMIATDDTGRLLIDYLGPPRTFPYVSAGSVLDGTASAELIQDRIVIVAATAVGLYDVRSTPFGSVFPGAEIHATVIDNVLSGGVITKPAWATAYDLFAIVVLGSLIGIVNPRVHAVASLLFVGGMLLGYVALVDQALVRLGVWLNLVYPLLAVGTTYTVLTAYHYVSEQLERRKIHDAFGRYVAPDVITAIMKDPSRLTLGGEEKIITVLFSDLAGFSSFSERYSPQELFALMSEYNTRMTERIFECDGMLNEYIGDELMALFGAPLELEDHAGRACAAALAMRAHRVTMCEEWLAIGRPRLAARTGINSGVVLVGNLGSEYRYHYGVLGDNVNLASRLEGLNKQYHTEILVSESTAELAGDGFRMREVDVVRVVGKQRGTRIYELLGHRDAVFPDEQEHALRCYTAAIEAYRAQRWREAADALRDGLARWPNDGPSQVMLERCLLYADAPPEGEWDGVFVATRK